MHRRLSIAMARFVEAPLRGDDAGDGEDAPVLPMEAAQMAAMERKIKCTLPRLDAARAGEVVGALEVVIGWSTAADGWLRAPGAYTLVRKLVDLFYVRSSRSPGLPHRNPERPPCSGWRWLYAESALRSVCH